MPTSTSLPSAAVTAAPTPALSWSIGLIGYGEVGRILAEDLRAQGVTVSAYDRKLDLGQGAGPMAHNFDLNGEFAQEAQA